MNFRPGDQGRRLWDTWGVVQGGLFHLFYLGNPAPAANDSWQPWDGIGHAVSRDLLDWEERPTTILRATAPGRWDSGVILTGNVFPFRGAWGMTYSAVDGSIQKGGIAVSRDLDTWRPIPENPVLVAAPPYEGRLEESISDSVEFRDVSIYQNAGGYEALFCGRLATGPHNARGVVGRALSRDGIHWEFAAPLFHPRRFNCLEVPTRFEEGGGHYLFFTTNYHLEGLLSASRYPQLRWLTYFAVSPSEIGPFSFSPDNLLAPGDSTVGRVYRFGGELLFVHHLSASQPALALPKLAVFEGGGIRLHPWKGIDSLSGSARLRGARSLEPQVKKGLPTGDYIAGEQGLLRAEGATLSVFTPAEYRDCRLKATLDWRGARRAGILLRERPSDGRAILLVLDRDAGEAAIGTGWRKGFCQVGMELRHRYRLIGKELERLEVEAVVRSEGVDWFFDGALVYTTVHEDTPAEGRTGFFVQDGTLAIEGLDLVDLRPERTYA